tara:strand:+ start:171 stop:506 length:336 start_codon:yes stop_codon:yes gene_type:complete
MFGFHPFSTQPQISIVPFLDVQTTTNVVTASQGTLAFASTVFPTTAGLITSTVQAAGAQYVFTATFLPESNVITLDSNTPSVFTYNEVADNIGETWSDVTTTSTTESWSDV